jgi:hypothetical protein
MFSPRISKVVVAMSAMLLTGAAAHGALQLLQFEPTPVSPNLPEFSWTGPAGNFVTGPGAAGNGDGDLAVNAQTPGGLEVDTPLVIPGLPNSTIDAAGTHFFDVTMHLSSDTVAADLADYGAGIVTPTSAQVPLTNATFSIYTTPAADSPAQLAAGPVLLLSGTLSGSSLTVPTGSTSAGFQTSTVMYTGGALLTALNGGTPVGGSASISLVSLDGNIGIVIGNPIVAGVVYYGSIAPFDANATGVFDTPNVPEPASMGIILAAGGLGLRRRRA